MKQKAGFTLIEVMITVAIVGIIAALAYPSYMNSVRKSNRAEAKTELMDIAQRLQRCYTSLTRYDDNDPNRCPVYADLLNGGIISRGSGFYRINIAPLPGQPTRTAYELTAEAILPPQTEDTGCPRLTLTSTGVRGPDGCW